MYRYSQLDQDNIKWFLNDPSARSLYGIHIISGDIRGLRNLEIEFNSPITAIAGKNGSGKTTVLALAACAFHNNPEGFPFTNRKFTYYTFSDFFIQTMEEVPIGGVYIHYKIHYNYWKITSKYPDRVGVRSQLRKKKKGGKWNAYEKRVERDVIFFGINRVVPHAEKSTSKTYRRLFKESAPGALEGETKNLVGKILDRDYDSLHFTQHTKYSMPVVKHRGDLYSGFNMGAGEDSLIEVLKTILSCPEKSLILIDEIELGLHEEAQRKLVNELKQICFHKKIQIICTTHSSAILDALPPDGRIFLEKVGGKTVAISKISSAFAVGKLSGRPNPEITILVEDEVAKKIVDYAMDYETKRRVNIISVGSSTAVMRHLAGYNKEGKNSVCVILDGDQRTRKTELVDVFMKTVAPVKEKESTESWVSTRMSFLPGSTWPEGWVCGIREADFLKSVSEDMVCDPANVVDLLDRAIRAGKHNEFYEISSYINSSEEEVSSILIKHAIKRNISDKEDILNYIKRFFR